MVKHYDYCPKCGEEFVYTASGDYYPASFDEPASYPEIEIIVRNCEETECGATNDELVATAQLEG